MTLQILTRKVIIYWNAHGTLGLLKKLFWIANAKSLLANKMHSTSFIETLPSIRIQNFKLHPYPRPNLAKVRINLLLDKIDKNGFFGKNEGITKLSILLANALGADIRIVVFSAYENQDINLDIFLLTLKRKDVVEISFLPHRSCLSCPLDIAENDYFLTEIDTLRDKVSGFVKPNNLIFIKSIGGTYEPNFKALLAKMLEQSY